MKHDLRDKINLYLNKYEYRPGTYSINNTDKYRCAVVVPVYNESKYLPALLNSLTELSSGSVSRAAFIFVVNNPCTDKDTVKADNLKSNDLLKEYKSKLPLYIIDAFSAGLAPDDKNAGVGLARKIGLDAALRILDCSPGSKPFLVCLDSDCTVNGNYLNSLYTHYDNPENEAGVCSYSHIVHGNEDNFEAILAYEFYLRYYSLGLRYAGSPLCYHSIGSTMTFTPGLYVKCEGMNKRKAGEDFYFLEKAAKHTHIPVIHDALVYPSSRESERVPFGTGRRIIRHNRSEINPDQIYDFTTFEIIRKWYDTEPDFSMAFTPSDVMNISFSIHQGLAEFLEESGFFDAYKKIRANSKTDFQLRKQISGWMDSFRILKLIHYLRDHHLPEKPVYCELQRLCTAMGIVNRVGTNPDASLTLKLELLRNLQAFRI